MKWPGGRLFNKATSLHRIHQPCDTSTPWTVKISPDVKKVLAEFLSSPSYLGQAYKVVRTSLALPKNMVMSG